MASRPEMLGHRTIRGKKPLGVSGGLEALHAPLSLPGGLVGVLRPVVEIPMLAVRDARQNLPFGGSGSCPSSVRRMFRDFHCWSQCILARQMERHTCLGSLRALATGLVSF
jgi:hypothetical protein